MDWPLVRFVVEFDQTHKIHMQCECTRGKLLPILVRISTWCVWTTTRIMTSPLILTRMLSSIRTCVCLCVCVCVCVFAFVLCPHPNQFCFVCVFASPSQNLLPPHRVRARLVHALPNNWVNTMPAAQASPLHSPSLLFTMCVRACVCGICLMCVCVCVCVCVCIYI